MSGYKDIAEDLLLNATDYIGNEPEKFGADNKDLDNMRNDKMFRQKVSNEVSICPEEYQNLSQ